MNESTDAIWAVLPYATDYLQAGSDYLIAKNIPEHIGSVRDTFLDELKEHEGTWERAKKRLALGGAAISLAWEWGPLNEITAAIPSIAVLEATGSPVSAGIVGGAIYAAQQGIFGLATAGGINAIPKTEQAIQHEFNTANETGAKGIDRILLLLGMGTSAVIVNEHARNKEQTLKKDVALLGKLVLLLSAVDVAVFTSANGLIENSERVGMDSGAVIDVATNPLTYIGLFGLVKFAGAYRKYRQSPEAVSNKNTTAEVL